MIGIPVTCDVIQGTCGGMGIHFVRLWHLYICDIAGHMVILEFMNLACANLLNGRIHYRELPMLIVWPTFANMAIVYEGMIFFYGHDVPPFLGIACIVGSGSTIMGTWVFIMIYKFWHRVEEKDKKRVFSELVKAGSNIMGFFFVIVSYIIYICGYRFIERNHSENILAVYSLIGITLLLKFWLVTMGFMIHRMDPSLCNLNKQSIFICHSCYLCILRSSAASSILLIFALSFMDIVKLFWYAFVLYMKFEPVYLIKQKMGWNKPPEGMSQAEFDIHHQNEQEAHMMDIAATFMIESVAEITTSIIWMTVVGCMLVLNIESMFAGIGVAKFGASQIENFSQFYISLSLVNLLEIVICFIAYHVFREKHVNINLANMFLDHINVANVHLQYNIVYNFGLLILATYLPWGVDTGLTFEWL